MRSDREIIEAVLQGDANQFREIIDRYQSLVAGTIAGMVGVDNDQFHDLGQQVFIRFYNSLSRFRFESSVGTFLTRVAINVSLNAIRKQKLFRSRFEYSDFTQCETPSEKSYHELIELVHTLPVKARVPIVLRYIHGYSNEEASKIMKISEGAFRTRLSRSLRELKKIYEKESSHD